MTQLSPEAQALLDAGREALTPSTATKDGVLRSIEANLATGTAVAGSGAFAIGKIWLALTLAVGIGGGWLVFRQSDSVSKPEVVAPALAQQGAEAAVAVAPAEPAPSAPPVAVTEELATPAQENPPVQEDPPAQENPPVQEDPPAQEDPPVQTKPVQRTRREQREPKPAQTKPNDLLAERTLIASAQRAIRSKNYSEAKTLLKQHEQAFPKGILRPERQAARAIANCLEPSGTNGKAIARRFLEQHAKSPLAPRVRSICEIPE